MLRGALRGALRDWRGSSFYRHTSADHHAICTPTSHFHTAFRCILYLWPRHVAANSSAVVGWGGQRRLHGEPGAWEGWWVPAASCLCLYLAAPACSFSPPQSHPRHPAAGLPDKFRGSTDRECNSAVPSGGIHRCRWLLCQCQCPSTSSRLMRGVQHPQRGAAAVELQPAAQCPAPGSPAGRALWVGHR